MAYTTKIISLPAVIHKRDTRVFKFDLDRYSIWDEKTEDMTMHIAKQEHNILHMDGFGFMSMPSKELFTYESGFVFCSGLYLYDPLRGRTVVSHLPINNSDIDHFLDITFPKFSSFLDTQKISFSGSRTSFIYGTEPYAHTKRSPGYIVSEELQKRYKIKFNTVFQAKSGWDSFLYSLKDGSLIKYQTI